ncbi:MAG: hypothetical protein ACREVJ_12585, partial [Gammaproteobacteria bacterium]
VEGRVKKVTERGAARLAEQIVQTINAQGEMSQKRARTEAVAISDFPGPGRVTMPICLTEDRTW